MSRDLEIVIPGDDLSMECHVDTIMTLEMTAKLLIMSCAVKRCCTSRNGFHMGVRED